MRKVGGGTLFTASVVSAGIAAKVIPIGMAIPIVGQTLAAVVGVGLICFGSGVYFLGSDSPLNQHELK